jgi:hypothetical protein
LAGFPRNFFFSKPALSQLDHPFLLTILELSTYLLVATVPTVRIKAIGSVGPKDLRSPSFGFQLFLQGGNPLLIVLTLPIELPPEGYSPILEEFLQPSVKYCRLEFQLLAEIKNWQLRN